MFADSYRGRRVLVTGHTGFKGSWLVTWLLELGAEVGGYALPPPSEPSNFEVLDLAARSHHRVGDVRDRGALVDFVREFQPEVVFHLAAQALVRTSYEEPAWTFETNTMGTLNVLEAVRQVPSVRALVVVTSDKCYRNVEWDWGYRENDVLGGEDPYSGSKACAELVAYSYIHSFFKPRNDATAVATARAGNVIGGGDWAVDRIIPDCYRAWSEGRAVRVRNPASTRPWQHVLEPLSGYLLLGSRLIHRDAEAIWQSYNFGPDATVNTTVAVLISELAEGWRGARWEIDPGEVAGRSEARLLKLSCDKALADLGWRPVLALPETIALTRDWYRRYAAGGSKGMIDFTRQQIETFYGKAVERKLPWVR